MRRLASATLAREVSGGFRIDSQRNTIGGFMDGHTRDGDLFEIGVVVRDSRDQGANPLWDDDGLIPASGEGRVKNALRSMGTGTLARLGAAIGEEMKIISGEVIARLQDLDADGSGDYHVDAAEFSFGVSTRLEAGSAMSVLIDGGAESTVQVKVSIARRPATPA